MTVGPQPLRVFVPPYLLLTQPAQFC